MDNPEILILGDEAFTYDNVGNRLTAADTTGDWTYNQNNELGGYDDVSYEYDANGNTTKKVDSGVTTSYVYNIEDRLAEVWDGEVGSGTLVAEYYYDPFGRRLWKDVGGMITNFHYSDEGLIGEYDAAGSEIKSYGYKPGGTWTSDPMFLKESSKYYFYQNDHLGTPQKLISPSGAVEWEAKYSSFGEATVEAASSVTSNLRFPGQYYDEETGLHYNWHRYYDPTTGRYVTADPIGLAGGINPFLYANVNPINYIDPEGLWGFAIDAGGAYGTGDGSAKYSHAGSAATGFYIGGRNTKVPNQRGSHAEIGGFTYQGRGDTAGAKIGLGLTLTHYKIVVDNFFKGILDYKSLDFLGLTYTKYYDNCGKEVGWSWSFGKGIGFAKEKGTVQGWSSALQ